MGKRAWVFGSLAFGIAVVSSACSSSNDANNGSGSGGTGGAANPGPIGGGSGGATTGTGGNGTVGSGSGGIPAGGSGGMTGSGGAPASGTGGMTAGTGGTGTGGSGNGDMTSGTGGMDAAGTGGASGDGGTPAMSEGGCTPAPSGTFQTMAVTGTGPDGNYTIYRPTTLGENGFVHPPVAWGNGLGTVPSQYDALLSNVASNGFVVIANPGTGSDPQVVRQGLEWLLAQNDSGEYAGKLAVDCAGTIGYSMGGGAAVGAGAHPAVKAVVSIHGLQDASEAVSGPLLLTTSDDDGFVTPDGYVQPCYDRSSVQPTIMAMYITGNTPSINGHLTPIGDGGQDADPMIAWLRYWLYGDQAQRHWFFGDDCTLCVSPWGNIQRKNYDWN